MNGESYGTGTSFEYDEDTEAGGDEAVMEDEQAEDEAIYMEDSEGDGEDTEGDEAVIEADSEVDEAQDEGDAEGDGEVDEAYSASTQLRMERNAQGRAAYERRLAVSQQKEARAAASTQRSIQSQLRAVQPGGPTKVQTVGSLQGAGVVTAILPNGRRSRMRIIPTVAPISEVNRLKSVMAVNDKRSAVATARNSRAIAKLASAQAAAARKLTAQQVASDKLLSKQVAEAHSRLDKRITKELSGGSGTLDKHGKRMMRLLKRQRQRSIMNSVLLATSAPFFASYGERDNPFGKKNLILTTSVLGFMLGDEVIDQFAGKSKGARGLATTWSYAAPLANGLTSFFAFRNKQNERFISSVSEIPTTAAFVDVDLKAFVKKGSFTDFAGKQHSVVASFIDPSDVTELKAVISADGTKLTLSVEAAPTATVKVAWLLDTNPSATPTTTT